MTLQQIKTSGTHFWDWIDRRTIFRRSIIVFALFMTWDATVHAWEFSDASKFDGTGTAAVIFAVLAPLVALQKFAFDIYNDARKDKEE